MKNAVRAQIYQPCRLVTVVGLVALGFVVILGRLFVVQIGHRVHWQARATQQYTRHATLQPERGRILDRSGRVLATSVAVPSVYAVPRDILHPEAVVGPLAEVLGIPSEAVRHRLASDTSFVWLARHVLPQTVTRLQDLNLPGIHFLTEMRRYYPKHRLAGQLLGFVGIDGQGLGGLEFRYDAALKAMPRRIRQQRDAIGRHIGLTPQEVATPPHGADLYITLDERLQHVAEKELAAQVQDVGAKSGLVVIMQPYTGDILAMASYPFFNPNRFQEASQRRWQRNRSITDPVEPGSTFKVVLAAAALEEQVVGTAELLYCEEGSFRHGHRRLQDYKPYGYLSFTDVMAHSSNIGAVKVADRLTSAQLYDYIRRFGFGERTSIDLPGEHHGQVYPLHQWSGFSHDSLALGQEITVTPIQLVRAFAAVANGGWLVQPRIVWRMVRDDAVHIVPPRKDRRILSLRTTQQLSSILSAAVDYGTGQAAAVDGYTVAGKTGTAQKVDPIKGGYSHTEVLASFVGYAPAEAPRVVVLVMIDEPQNKRWGGQAAAPVFRRVVQQTLHYLQVPPSQAPRLPLPVTNTPTVAGRQIAQRLAPPVGTGVVRLLGTH